MAYAHGALYHSVPIGCYSVLIKLQEMGERADRAGGVDGSVEFVGFPPPGFDKIIGVFMAE